MRTDNELIAEFMGVEETVEKFDSYGIKTPCYYTSNGLYRTLTTLQKGKSLEYFGCNAKYDASWDWLMPVVEKIENIDTDDLYFHIIFRLAEVQYFGFGVQKFTGNTKIEATHKAVVGFIKWYNQQKP